VFEKQDESHLIVTSMMDYTLISSHFFDLS